jgi:hypothetical protein
MRSSRTRKRAPRSTSSGCAEIAGALERAYQSRTGGEMPQDVLLITDGEVGDWQPVVERAIASRHRVFTVGVGAAVAEAFVRTLAARTGGACELVSPNEGMAERITRHFQRMSAPHATRARRGRGGRIRYDFVDEYPEEEREYSFSPATSARPLSFGEVVRLLEAATVSGMEPEYANLITGAIELNLAEGADLLEMVRFVRVTSTYYPQLEAYFEARFEAWGEQKQRAIDEEERADEARAEERERRLAPFRAQINAEMDRIAVAWPPTTSMNGAIARGMGLAKRHTALEEYVLENGTLPPRNEGG